MIEALGQPPERKVTRTLAVGADEQEFLVIPVLVVSEVSLAERGPDSLLAGFASDNAPISIGQIFLVQRRFASDLDEDESVAVALEAPNQKIILAVNGNEFLVMMFIGIHLLLLSANDLPVDSLAVNLRLHLVAVPGEFHPIFFQCLQVHKIPFHDLLLS